MKKGYQFAAAVAIFAALAGCEQQPTGVADAQQPSLTATAGDAAIDGAHRRGPGRGSLARVVLRLQETLGLTAGQVSSLEQIQADLVAANEPLFAQVAEIMGEYGRRGAGSREEREARRDSLQALSDAERQAWREQQRAEREARMEQARPILEQIRANTEAANESARALLTDEQLATLEEQRDAHQQEREQRRGERGRGGRGGPGGR